MVVERMRDYYFINQQYYDGMTLHKEVIYSYQTWHACAHLCTPRLQLGLEADDCFIQWRLSPNLLGAYTHIYLIFMGCCCCFVVVIVCLFLRPSLLSLIMPHTCRKDVFRRCHALHNTCWL